MVLADHQTEGRGRRGRAWTAPPGTALLFSVVLRPRLPVARWPEIPLAAGCAVAEGLERAAGVTAALKWPNDVLVAGRKLAGILAEGVAGTPPLVVLGVGVNVSQGEADWPPDLAGRARSLADLAAPVTRAELLGAVLARLEAWYGSAPRRGVRARAGRVAAPGPPRHPRRAPRGGGDRGGPRPRGRAGRPARGWPDRAPGHGGGRARPARRGGRALMLLAVDVGNTNVKLGVYDGQPLVASWRLTTRREQTADEYGVFTHTMLRSRGLEPARVAEIAISSTVPAIQRTLEDMAGRYFSLSPFVVEPGVNVAVAHARRLPARGRPRPRRQGRGRRGALRAAADHHRLRDRDDLRVRVGRRRVHRRARSPRASRRPPRR